MLQENETWSVAFVDNKRGFVENSIPYIRVIAITSLLGLLVSQKSSLTT